jgi:exodeoxyribonuclease VII small subunit
MTKSVGSEDAPSFETSLEELQSIVRELEDGSLGLEAALARFEQGVRLLRSCHKILEQTEQKIEILTGTDPEGQPLTAPFEAQATLFDAPAESAKPGRRRSASSRNPPRSAPPSTPRDDGGTLPLA